MSESFLWFLIGVLTYAVVSFVVQTALVVWRGRK